jgi:putative membrane protein
MKADKLKAELSEPAERVATSAVALENSADRQLESAIRRTQLAANRTVLAAERSYSAWLRTALAAMAFGVGTRLLLDDFLPAWIAAATGSLFVVFSGGCLVAAMWREVRPSSQPPEASTRHIPFVIVAVVNGFLLLMALAALIGMWVIPL